MNLPDLPHLQFAVLSELIAREKTGRDIREALKTKHKVKRSSPAFYQLMGRLEEAGMVEGRYEQSTVDGQPIKIRWYKITAPGNRAWHSTRDFYIDSAASTGAQTKLALEI